jgi:hypothetical protein
MRMEKLGMNEEEYAKYLLEEKKKDRERVLTKDKRNYYSLPNQRAGVESYE